MKEKMNKRLVQISIFFLVLLITLVLLGLKTEVKATHYTSVSALISDGYAIDGLEEGDTVFGGTEEAVFGNDSVFCVEAGQNYKDSKYTYTLSKIITVDEKNNTIYQGLVNIANSYKKSNYEFNIDPEDFLWYFNNSQQIAMWAYIYSQGQANFGRDDSGDDYFKIGTCIIDDTNEICWIKGTSSSYPYYGTASREKYSGKWDTFGKAAEHAYEILQDVTTLTDNTYKGKIYIFTSINSQNFIIFGKPEEVDNTKVKLKFYKEDFNEKGLNGATIKLSSSDATLSSTTLTSASNGFFGEIEITPTENDGTVTVKIDEIKSPTNCLPISSAINLTIEYDTETGSITSVTESSEYIDFNFSGDVDSDGSVEVYDSGEIMKASTGQNTPASDSRKFKIMDIDNNKSITAGEAGTVMSMWRNDVPLSGIIFIKNRVIPEVGVSLEYKKGYSVLNNGLKDLNATFTVKFEQSGSTTKTSTIRTNETTSVKWQPSNFNEITATITEESVENGYGLIEPFTVKFTYDSSTNKWVSSSGWTTINNGIVTLNNNSGVASLGIIDIPFANIEITKKDEVGNTLQGVTFSAKIFSSNESGFEIIHSSDSDLTTNSSGRITISNIKPKSKTMYLLLREKSSTAVSTKLKNKDLIVRLNWDETNNKWVTHSLEINNLPMQLIIGTMQKKAFGDTRDIMTANVDYSLENNTNNTTVALDIKNESELNKIILTKKDLGTGNPINNVKFTFTIENVKSCTINGTAKTAEDGEIESGEIITNSAGQIEIDDVVLSADQNQIRITIHEIGLDGYRVYPNDIVITLSKTSSGFTLSNVEKGSITDQEFNIENDISLSTAKDQTLSISLKNIQVIELAGQVWLDGQTGIKGEIAGPDGYKNDGKYVNGVKVYLYNADASGNKTGAVVQSTTTTNNGEYKFENVLKTANGYKIEFEYNGMWYEDTTPGKNSDATENDVTRNTFNGRFTTIEKGKSSDGTLLSYTYKDGESTLNTDVAGNNSADTSKNFKMQAQTAVYKETDRGIDLGLVERFFDLAIGTDVKEAKVSINDKTVTYNYAQIMNGAMADLSLDEILQGQSSENDIPEYNLYLYASDYNYRIADYKTDGSGISNKVNPQDASNVTPGSELQVEVTYNVILKNQTKKEAEVKEFVYYHDTNYRPKFNVNDIINGYKVKSIEGNKITFESTGTDNKLVTPDYRKEVNLTFIVNKNPEGYVILEDYTNIVEITKYSSTEGIIDDDSAPNNGITDGKITQYEDDTDEAKGIKISIEPLNKTRKIAGTVWDDGAKNSANGQLNDGEQKVNDVIVQLIEVKNISGVGYCEYIWQETRSGRNVVKTTARNGYAGADYTNSVVANSGMYEFTNFIPGNYIVRFIYGDGTTYDITTDTYKSSATNVQKYNGHDYQSTNDLNYNKSWYNTAGYTDGYSVARDNEARRLEVMAYSTTIDKSKAEHLTNKTKEMLDATWMAAETSRIYVPVDGDVSDTNNNTTTSSNSSQNVNFANINFGLVARPNAKLVLEKHITGLKITPSGVGVQPIVDAKVDIRDIIEDNGIQTDEISGLTTGLATMVSTRDNRSWWKVETDIEELTQGAKLEVEYTYVIKNESEVDYLSKTLVEAYENSAIKSYTEALTEIKNAIKTTMKNGEYAYKDDSKIGMYLGNFYYTGVVPQETDSTQVLVSSRAETLKESLNEQLGKQENVGDDFDAVDATDSDLKTYIDKDGNTGTKEILTVLNSKEPSGFLQTSEVDYSKTANLTTILSSVTNGNVGATYDSYITEITSYSNAAGRRNIEAMPENLSYVHSEDTRVTMNSITYSKDGEIKEAWSIAGIPAGATIIRTANEQDEFWGESIIISKPTGENKQIGLQIAIISTISVAILGVGIILIKKFVLKK